MHKIIAVPLKTEDQKTPLRVVAYCRVSTVSDEQAGSLEMQKRSYANLIEQTPNWYNVGVFADTGSGRNLSKRPEFNALMTLCRQRKVDLIITKSISRFGRNTVDALRALEELRLLDVDVWFEAENIHLLKEDRRLVLEVLMAVAQGESESKSENIRWGLWHAFKSPDSKTSHFTCYGYRHDDAGHLIINEAEAETVRLIFRLRADGVSLRKIADELERLDIPSPTGKPRWSAETLKKVLQNEKYIGQVRLQKTYVEDFFSGKQVKNRGQWTQWLIENHHEPIVDMEIWERVNGETAVSDYID